MLDSSLLVNVISRLKGEGWHYENELYQSFAPYQIGSIVEILQVLLAAGTIRAAGEAEKRRYRWVGRR